MTDRDRNSNPGQTVPWTPIPVDNEMANTLLVAFDNNLFDTDSFYDLLPTEPIEFRDAYEQTVRGDYSQDSYADPEYSPEAVASDLRAQGVDVSTAQIRRVFNKAPEFLYEPATLNYLKEEHGIDEVVLVSRTQHPAWQRRKISASGVERYVDDIIVVHDPETVDQEPADPPEDPMDWNALLINTDGTDIDEETVLNFLDNTGFVLQDVIDYLE